MSDARLANDEAWAFVTAGRALFTVRNTATGGRFTYKVTAKPARDGDDRPAWFVKALVGPDNEADYAYIGLLTHDGRLVHTRGSRTSNGAPCFRAFVWLARHARSLHANVEVWHHGRCGRCGRTLTVPESVARGLGPDCAGL